MPAIKPITKLTELRNILESFMKSQSADAIPPTTELIKAFRKKHRKHISAVSEKLEDLALVKLVNDVSSRKRNPVAISGEPDLFGHYPGIPEYISIPLASNGPRRYVRKLFAKATIDEINAWLDGGRTSRRSRRESSPGVVAAINDVTPFASGHTVMEEAARARRTAQRVA